MLVNKKTYSDLPFFISKNGFTNDLNLIKDLTTVRQALKNIVLTNIGERPFDDSFGGNMYEELFENFTLDKMFTLQTKLAIAIKTYEPRVDINDVIIYGNPKNNSLDVKIDFYISPLNISEVITISITRNR